MNESRRSFIKKSFIGMVALPVVSLIRSRTGFGADCKPTDIDSKLTLLNGLDSKSPDQISKNFGYYQDAKKVDTTKYDKRKGAAGAKQFCNNCNFYQNCKTKDSTLGGCQVIPGKKVTAKGWCNLWTQKG